MLLTPRTLDGVLKALAEPGARLVAGATSLLVDIHRGAPPPPVLVDVTGVAGLDAVAVTNGGQRIGATTTLAALTSLPGVVGGASALIASSVVRSQATVGGNLAADSWPRDLAAALWVVGAHCEIVGAALDREVEVVPGGPQLNRGEVLVALAVPDTEGAVVAGAGPSPSRPYVVVAVAPLLGRAAARVGTTWHALPSAVTGTASETASIVVDGLRGLGVPAGPAAALGAEAVAGLGRAA